MWVCQLLNRRFSTHSLWSSVAFLHCLQDRPNTRYLKRTHRYAPSSPLSPPTCWPFTKISMLNKWCRYALALARICVRVSLQVCAKAHQAHTIIIFSFILSFGSGTYAQLHARVYVCVSVSRSYYLYTTSIIILMHFHIYMHPKHEPWLNSNAKL